jgi:NAD(P)H-dependent FMN reductase
MDDEPDIPAAGKAYANPLTRAWSEKIAAAPAVVFVTPQYNWGYPAPLKNALDHLYREWRGKPALIVSYGGHGGGKCAVQLRQVLDGLKMRTVPTMPGLILSDDLIHGAVLDPALQFAGHIEALTTAFHELATALEA